MKTTNKTVLDTALEQIRKSITLKKEWADYDFKKVQRKIAIHFFKSYDYCNNWLGLAFTSSSDVAAYWVCNIDLTSGKYPNYKYIGFAMDENEKVYAILWDKDENEILQPL